MRHKNKLIILTGPSCAGKTPLEKSLRHIYPEIDKNMKRLVAYNSRPKRPSEADGVDYHFRSRSRIRQRAKERRMILIEARGDLHGIDINELCEILRASDAFYEGNTFMAREIISFLHAENIAVLSIFLSPFSKSELEILKSEYTGKEIEEYIFNHMMPKLIRRAQNFKIELTDSVLSNLKQRAGDACQELNIAHLFDHVLVNHDGEDSIKWNDPQKLSGDVLRSVQSLAALIQTGKSVHIENWKKFTLCPTR